MYVRFSRLIFVFVPAILLAACNGSASNRTIPAGDLLVSAKATAPPIVRTSVLKSLAKQTVIGSTVDPLDGDRHPRGLAYSRIKIGAMPAGSLFACNYANKKGVAGAGTTIVGFAKSAPGAKTVRYAQDAALRGCSSLTIDAAANIWVAATTAKLETSVARNGKVAQKFGGAKFRAPFNDTFGTTGGLYPTAGIFVGDAKAGTIVRIDPIYFNPVAVVSGFAVKAGSPGPTAMQYDAKLDTLYVADGVNDTVVAIAHALNLYKKSAIVVKPGGKTFGGPDGSWARVIHSGAPLNGVIGSTLLSNHNLIFTNSLDPAGKNLLVEIARNGKVLATRNVDSGAGGALAGIVSTGSTDATTRVYFTDANADNVQMLSR
jgi:hypothetical protein